MTHFEQKRNKHIGKVRSLTLALIIFMAKTHLSWINTPQTKLLRTSFPLALTKKCFWNLETFEDKIGHHYWTFGWIQIKHNTEKKLLCKACTKSARLGTFWFPYFHLVFDSTASLTSRNIFNCSYLILAYQNMSRTWRRYITLT